MSQTKKQQPTILIVDDNQANLELLQAYMEDVDCRIITAYDGPEALEKVQAEMPDLVLLDIMMPKMSGFEVCKKIKTNPQTENIPVIMVTALTEFGDIELAIEAGAEDFLSKPVNKLELIARVRTMLKLKHLTDKLQKTLAYLSQVESNK